MKILLLEDDAALRDGIAFKLKRDGHQVHVADSVQSAQEVLGEPIDAAILDITLPDGSGLSVCQSLRQRQPGVHILMLTAQDTELDTVIGYESGCDDYVTKPFSLAVLMGKLSAVQRRLETAQAVHAELALDAARQCVIKRGTRIDLTRNELRLLDMLMRHPGQVLTKGQLLESLWDAGGEFVDENTLAVNIRRLREKIEDDPSKPRLIENVRGVGYRFKEAQGDA